ncbi:glycoside hydrolase family protein [Acinetobacter haemolyticus]|uniref:lysozyme n=1 Tax=Acinetobacter haemolyticus TaxID=29430 RepID=UPI001372C319|nr:lysozyme [Acinetobacter haemolyticus]NAR50089.1 glycoside hydrolase family protein [Acinetobacter haemolyticus]NAR54371.1 glycoside hydrolase family protein [Acinetobacter haemolyticus]
MDRTPFFIEARALLGGKLTQYQVDRFNELLDEFQGKSAGNKSKTTSSVGINLITSFESLKLTAYLCPAKVWTIGFGTTVYSNGIRVKQGDKCTESQAKAYFAYDLNRFERAVNGSVAVPLSQNQFDALVSLTYNIGENAFKSSTLLKMLNAGNYRGAADQFLVWNKSNGEVLNGLVRRRKTERELFLK